MSLCDEANTKSIWIFERIKFSGTGEFNTRQRELAGI
jgi:hypothetical protein